VKELIRRFRAWLKRIVIHEARIIIAAPIVPGTAVTAPLGDGDFEGLIIESPAALEAVAAQIPQAFSYAKLRKAIEASFLVCVRRTSPDGSERQIVAYRICQRGIFSTPGTRKRPGIRKRISPDFVFVQWAEVLPEYRGKRIAYQLKRYLHDYARANNVRWTCGLVSVTNAASLAAHLRAQDGSEPKVIGRIDTLHLFGGRYVLATPWWCIKKALDDLSR
jgi:GNAT superfamily N-acetyltransferase